MQFLTTGVARRDQVIHRLAAVAGQEARREWDGVTPPVLIGNCDGMDLVQIECRAKGIPYVYIDHAYFKRDFQMRSYRICASGFHCSDWRDSDRVPAAKMSKWQQGSPNGHIVVIEPSDSVKRVYRAEKWLDTTMDTLKNCTQRRIVVKQKGVGGLRDALTDSWCAVTFGSVADVEAALFGIPVFCSEHSPAVPIGLQDFSKVETPIFPDRAKWLRSLAAAEYSAGEETLAWERVCHFLPTAISAPQ